MSEVGITAYESNFLVAIYTAYAEQADKEWKQSEKILWRSFFFFFDAKLFVRDKNE